MNHENNQLTKSIIEGYFAALKERILPVITLFFAPVVDWHVPGDSELAPWTGHRSTKEEVADFFELLWANTEPLTVDVQHFLVQQGSAVITGKFSTRMLATGKIVDSPFCIQIRLENGLIVQYELLEDSLAVARSLTP